MHRRITLAMTVVVLLGALPTGALAGAGTPIVAMAGTSDLHASTTDQAAGADSDLHYAWYEVRDDTLGPDQALVMDAVLEGSGNDTASKTLTATVDGERYALGELTADPEGQRVAVDTSDRASEVDVHIECEIVITDDGWEVHCKIVVDISLLAEGDHTVGLGDLEPTNVAVADGYTSNATLTNYTVEDRTLGTDQPLAMQATLEGDEPANKTLHATIDGDTYDLARVSVDPDAERVTVETVDGSDNFIDVEVRCEIIITDDGWIVRCEIVISATALSAGNHTVGLGDLEPTTVTVTDGQGATATVMNYSVADRTLRSDQPLEMQATVQGAGPAEKTLHATIDGERYAMAHMTVDPEAKRVAVEPVDGSDNFIDVEVSCEIIVTDDGWIVRCEIVISATALSADDHTVGVGDLEPTGVAVIGDGPGNVSGPGDLAGTIDLSRRIPEVGSMSNIGIKP